MSPRGVIVSVTIAAIATLTSALPKINFPLSSQLPSVARVSQPFSYTFASSTFSSNLPISYTLSSGPSWLSLDATTRILSGTPSVNDVGSDILTEVPISLTATDTSGSTSLNATLVISKSPAPSINISPSMQLATFGTFSSPSTLLYHPSSPFKFSFDPNTFSAGEGTSNLSYYAITTENTPVPAWITFDDNSLTFTGQTPDYYSLIQPPQTFGIKLIVSDVPRYAGTFISFEIEVGIHLLSFKNSLMTINATRGNNVSFSGLSDNLQFDGQAANQSVIYTITANTPQWLAFDNSTLLLSGTAPTILIPTNITVLATDIYGDATNATIFLDVFNSIFSGPIPNLNATIGSHFSYNLSTFLRNPSDVTISSNSTPVESWVSFNAATFILSGFVPVSVKAVDLEVSLTATSQSSHTSESQTFKLGVAEPVKPSQATISASKPTQTSSPHSSVASSAKSQKSNHKLSTRGILAIVVPITILTLILLIVALCYLKHRRDAKRRPRSPTKSIISAPLEAYSNVAEIDFSPPVAAPQPLHLDTSGFDDGITHGLTTNEKYFPFSNRRIEQDNKAIRQSKTLSAIEYLRDSQKSSEGTDASNRRTRSFSDNTLSKKDDSFRTTQGSSQQTRSCRTPSSQMLAREYSNYSRKGHVRRSKLPDANSVPGLRKSTTNVSDIQSSIPSGERGGDSILGLSNSNFSIIPLENFSAMGGRNLKKEIYEQENTVYIPEKSATRLSSRQQSRLLPSLDSRRGSGIGHGKPESNYSVSSISTNRRSFGPGQNWSTSFPSRRRSLLHNSRARPTSTTNRNAKRNSGISTASDYSDNYPSESSHALGNIRRGPDATFSPSQGSYHSRNSRPLSRRIGSSPFFGGGSSMRNSRMSSRRGRVSYTDSPTVPEEPRAEENLENTILHGLREESNESVRDSFGISYGMAREGTRQLKNLIQGKLSRSKTKGSVSSRDSRFESAPGSMNQLQILPQQEDRDGDEGDYENIISDDDDPSWETEYDSWGNIMQFDSPEKKEEGRGGGIMGRKRFEYHMPQIGRFERGSSFVEGEAGGEEVRMVRGARRRPVSVHARSDKRGGGIREGRTEGEGEGGEEDGKGDYAAYI